MTKNAKFLHYDLLGVRVDALTMAGAIDYITTAAADPKSKSFYVVKPYVEFIDRASEDPDARRLLNEGELSLPDGVALQWAASLLYSGKSPSRLWFWFLCASIVLWPSAIRKPLPEKFSGVTFTWPLLEACQKQKLRVYLIGSPIGRTIEDTAQTIQEVLPGIQIVGTAPGEIDGLKGQKLLQHLKRNSPSKEYIHVLREAKPDVVLIGMGFPLQEYVMSWLVKELPHGVLIGEGGTFDYASFGGTVVRAPKILQKLGLEWLWRLLRDPKRWRRQLAIPRFMYKMYRHAFAKDKV